MSNDDDKRPILFSSSSPLLYSFKHFHNSSLHTMSSTGFTEFIQSTTPPKSPTPSVSSVPNNTPADDTTPDQPLPPQLAIRSIPIEEDEISSIDYKSVAEDPNSAPQGFILNELDSHHFYPIHVPNPRYGKWDEEPCSIVTKYIQYNADYTYVTGTAGRGYSQHSIPVYISRQTRFYTTMTAAQWREFQHGAPQEFLINEAIADMADPRIVGEVNRLRGKMELRDTLDKLRRDAQHRLDEITKEYVTVPAVTLARKVGPGLQDLQTRAQRILAERNAEKAKENMWIGRMVAAESIGELNRLIKSRAA